MTLSYFIFITLLIQTASPSQGLKHGDQIVEIIGADQVNIREWLGTEWEILAKVPRGDRLKKLGDERGWYNILLPDGREGWVHGRYARPDQYIEVSTPKEVLVVTAEAINLRQNPATGAPEVTRAKMGDELGFLSERNNWYFIQTSEGRKAWVHKNDVAFRSKDPGDKPGELEHVDPSLKEEPKKTDRFQEGMDRLKAGDHLAALLTFRTLLKDFSNHSGAHYQIGRILKQTGLLEEALDHFQQALSGDPEKPEAQFQIDELRLSLKTAPAKPPPPTRRKDTILPGEEFKLLLMGGGLASLIFLVILLWVYLRRRRALFGGNVFGPSRRDKSFQKTLKGVAEKRPLLRIIEEAEKKQEAAEDQIRKKVEAFGGVSVEAGASLGLPEAEPVQPLLNRVEEIRQVVGEQEDRARMYSDLIKLQNEKIEALNDEIEALKRLVQLKSERPESKAKGSPKTLKA